MKSSKTLALILILFSSSLWAEQYNIWELDTKVIFSKILFPLIEFNDRSSRGACIIPINPLQQKSNNIEDEDWEPLIVAGSMTFYLKSKLIDLNIDIPEDMGKMYLNESLSKKARIFPVLGEGKQYVFFNQKQNKYYYCFIEWGKHMLKRGQRKEIWDAEMFASTVNLLGKVPRIYLAPLVPIGDDVFIKEDIALIIDETKIPHFIGQ